MEYEIDLFDVVDFSELLEDSSYFYKLAKFKPDEDFKDYFKYRCIEEVHKITERELSDMATGYYENHHRSENLEDGVRIYNEAMVDLSHLSPEYAQNYADGLSLAMLVEFGMGIGGTSNDVWKTMVNPDRNYAEGWYFINRYGQDIWTDGYEGKFIYMKLKETIEKKATEWLKDYIDITQKDDEEELL